jgi:RHS repeat-associated protein
LIVNSQGKERDTETGNDDFGARYYSNRFGRWLSADWSAVPVAVPYANLTNPQTLNLYAMVGDNPETFVDLDGHGGCHSDQYGVNHPAQTCLDSNKVTCQNSPGLCAAVRDSVSHGGSIQEGWATYAAALQAQGTVQQQNGTAAQGAGQAGGQQGLQNQQLKFKTVSGGKGQHGKSNGA